MRAGPIPACLALLALAAGCAEEDPRPAADADGVGTWPAREGLHRDLLPPRGNPPYWYRIIRAATRGAPENPGDLVDLPRRDRYDVTSFLTDVLHPDLLPKDWQERLVRVKDWPLGHPGLRTDAYYLRFEREGTLIHLLDTRGRLFLALAGKQLQNATEEQALAAQQLAFDIVLRPDLCEPTAVQRDDEMGIWTGGAVATDAEARKRGWIYITREPCGEFTRFTLVVHVCEGVVLFKFGKHEVIGCTEYGGGPLFRPADAKPTRMELLLDELEAIEKASPSDIARLAAILRDVPPFHPPAGMYMPMGNERLIVTARYLGCRKLVEALDGVDAGQPDALALVLSALRAVPAEEDMRHPRRAVQEAAIRALVRLHSPEAREQIESLHDAVTDRLLRRAARDALDRWPASERGRR